MADEHRVPASVDEVLAFWFGTTGLDRVDAPRDDWFRKDPDFDAQIRARFRTCLEAAARDGLVAAWQLPQVPGSPSALAGHVARIIVADQFSRNAFRDSARAFALDADALRWAGSVVDAGAERTLAGLVRAFVYLPFEHAESLAMQDRSVALFEAAAQDDPKVEGMVQWAHRHRDVIARFGRFPHRNAALGRPSTPAELAFLQEPGSSF